MYFWRELLTSELVFYDLLYCIGENFALAKAFSRLIYINRPILHFALHYSTRIFSLGSLEESWKRSCNKKFRCWNEQIRSIYEKVVAYTKHFIAATKMHLRLSFVPLIKSLSFIVAGHFKVDQCLYCMLLVFPFDFISYNPPHNEQQLCLFVVQCRRIRYQPTMILLFRMVVAAAKEVIVSYIHCTSNSALGP